MHLSTTLKEFYLRLNNIYQLECTKALLDWDQQVTMPEAAADGRGSQIEYLSVLRHQQMTDPELAQLARKILDDCEKSVSHEDGINAYWLHRAIERDSKLSESFVAERARISSSTFNLWQKAKPASDFNAVKDNLKKIVELARQEADLVGFKEHPYDALLDQYEPNATVSWVRPLLLELAESIKPLVAKSSDTTEIRKFPLPIELQKKLCEEIMVAFGLPKDSSRLDLSSHPFCTQIGFGDVRITTRLKEEDLLYGLGSVLHELGHALYEHNLPREFRGTACGSVYSLGMHESQSRFIENCIGRSKAFSEYLCGLYQRYADSTHAALVTPDDFYQAQNKISPSLIRVDADEVSYSLHVVIRMLLEIDLVDGSLSVDDLPARWNELYEKYLGIAPTTDREGVLQDVHWYSGSIGYFPTYVLGNIYDGVILEKLQSEQSEWETKISAGEFLPVTNWLKEKIHLHAARVAPREFMENFAGAAISSKPFVNYLKAKHLRD